MDLPTTAGKLKLRHSGTLPRNAKVFLGQRIKLFKRFALLDGLAGNVKFTLRRGPFPILFVLRVKPHIVRVYPPTERIVNHVYDHRKLLGRSRINADITNIRGWVIVARIAGVV